MKKTFKMMGMACLLGAFAFLGSSCKKNNDSTTIKVTMPTLEEINIDGERAYIDFSGTDRQMFWSKGDQIMYYNLNAADPSKSVRNVFTLVDGADEHQATFNGGVMGEAQNPGYYAFYPAQKVEAEGSFEDNVQTFVVPATQTYQANSIDPTSLVMACQGYAPSEGFHMEHIFGFANLKLKGTTDEEKVRSITIIDNDYNLTGSVEIYLPNVNVGGFMSYCNALRTSLTTNESLILGTIYDELQNWHYVGHGTGKEITLNCPDVALTTSGYTNFIITLRPGALIHGFQVVVEYEGGITRTFNKFNHGDPECTSTANPRQYCITPNGITNFKLN